MSRVIRITLALWALCAGAIGYYLVRPGSGIAPASSDALEYEPQKGVAERPADTRVLAGHYYRGDGTGYNVHLTLGSDGAYSAEWQGCLGIYGEAAGDWKLADELVVFTPSKEIDMMRRHLRALEVMKFQGNWILVPTDKSDREFYDKWGVSTYSCFQNTNSIFQGP
jgi:hypothetical protein